MNKIVKSLGLVSVAAVVIALASMTVNAASTSFVLTPKASASTEANATENETNNTPSALTLGVGNSIPETVEEANATTNEVANSTNNTNTSVSNSIANNTVSVNNINDGLAKEDIPQTGENDLYIVSAIGLVAIVIGSVSFVKSRK